MTAVVEMGDADRGVPGDHPATYVANIGSSTPPWSVSDEKPPCQDCPDVGDGCQNCEEVNRGTR